MSERAGLQRAILDGLEKAGYWAFRINTGGRQGRVRLAPDGTPDICLVSPPGWMEVKTPGKKLRESQEVWHAKARRNGVRVAVVTTLSEALAIAGEWARFDGLRDGLLLDLKRMAEEL